jgi:hypothetical protein
VGLVQNCHVPFAGQQLRAQHRVAQARPADDHDLRGGAKLVLGGKDLEGPTEDRPIVKAALPDAAPGRRGDDKDRPRPEHVGRHDCRARLSDTRLVPEYGEGPFREELCAFDLVGERDHHVSLESQVSRELYVAITYTRQRLSTAFFSSRSISRSMYQRAFFKSCTGSPFSPARHRYFMALPRQKFMCSVIWMHSTPDGWPV